jgi:beta-mannosidase
MVLLTLVLLAVAPPRAAAAEPTLVDHPLASGVDPVYLDGDWQASNAACGRALISRGGESVAGAPPLAAKVPGDILTDLQRAGKVKDPYWNVTWRDAAFIAAWNEGVWTYSQSFPTSPAMQSAADCLLVLDGVRMGAVVSLNGAWLANVTDQFLRYELPVGKHLLSSGDNVLTVEFTKDIATGGRSTYSNQIDWAPNFLTFDPTAQQVLDAQRIMGRQTFGFGIWKSVYVLPVPPKAAAIKQLVLHTFYEGGHPTSILGDGNHAGFEVRARLVLWAPAATTGTITVNIPGVSGASATLQASVPAGESNFSVIIPASATETVQLWHPRGNGGQHRYNITAGFAPAAAAAAEGESTPENKPEATAAAAAASTWRMLGFRHVALVTINDTDAAATAAAKDQDGSGQFGMFFRVNGAAVYARGGNKIPMDLIDGRMSASAHRRLVQSAADGNMNMLRVW